MTTNFFIVVITNAPKSQTINRVVIIQACLVSSFKSKASRT